VSAIPPLGRTAPPPDPPELPDAARPNWPGWYGPAALFAAFGGVSAALLPLIPAFLLGEHDEGAAGVTTLLGLVVQDSVLMASALLFATLKLNPRRWHFGIRRTPFWGTAGWAALGFGVMLAFELGYLELFHVNESNVDELGKGNLVAAIAIGLAVIVVAPVSEEFFFRAFFYRALRTRLRVWASALICGLVFGALHFEGPDTAVILPVIAFFGVGQCLVYEKTGSLFAVIAIHAAFNTVATLGISVPVALTVGVLVIGACAVVPRYLAPGPSPFGLGRRARALPA
jgi:membrane protease YdiL (CAAX protease family)